MKKLLLTINVMLFLAFSAAAQIDRSQPPKAGPAPKINLSKPQTFTMENGLKVMLVENHKLPRVNIVLLLDNPPVAEGEAAGVSDLLGSLLGSGTEKTPKDEFNEEIDYLGANLSFNASGARANTLSKYFPRVLELMAEGVLQPEFSQEEFDKVKQRQIEGLKSNEKDVAFNARRVKQALAFGKEHPYGEFPTPQSLEALNLEQVVSHYKANFLPNNAYLAIIGDFDPVQTRTWVENQFSGWEPDNMRIQDLPKVENPPHTQINFLDMPNAVQSEIAVVNTVELKKKDPDYFPALIANQILGGGGDGRLFTNLREDKGYTYGAYSSLENDRYAASFVATAQVRTPVTDSAVVAFLDEIHRIRNEKISQEELSNAKNKYIGNFVLSLEQPSTVASYALEIETEGLPEDFYETYLQKINAVSIGDVQRVARKYFNIDQARIVIAGKGSELTEKLEDFRYNGETIPVTYVDKLANEIERPEQKKELDPSVSLEDVFEKYLQAIGGKQAVKAIESVVFSAQATIQGMNLDLEMKQTSRGKFFQKIAVGGNTLSEQKYNGESGKILAQGQEIPYNEEMLEIASIEALPFPELTAKARLSGLEMVEEREAYVVSFGENYKAFYDVATGLKVRTIKAISQGGQIMEVPTTFRDYQEVEGVKFPHRIEMTAGPQHFEFLVKEIRINEGTSPEDFE